MAIKSISQLDRFDHKSTDQGTFKLGNALAFFNDESLTENDKNKYIAQAIFTDDNGDRRNRSLMLLSSDTSYWSSLFEISKPIAYSDSSSLDSAIEYESQSITYEKLMENIVWDVKSYLNARNNLNNYDLLSVIERDYTFTGNKTFANKVTVNGYANFLSSVTIGGSPSDGKYFVVNLDSTFNNLATFTDWAKIEHLSVHNSMRVSCDIVGETRDIVFDGYAYGLVDRDSNQNLTHTVTTIPPTSINHNSNNTLVGDPVWFYNGRPARISCVNCATSAYNIVDISGNGWNVGNGVFRTNAAGQHDDSSNQNNDSAYKSAVFFKNGIPYTTNVIDYSLRSYWADLGEKYLADDSYEPGTLIKFGGEQEITIADTEVNGIVSTNSFELNADLPNGTVIALCGRVPTKVKGKITKFDKIMLSDTPGIACKWDGISRVIGRALESNDDENIKLVECVTRFEI